MKVTLLVRAPKKPEKRVVVERDVVIGRGKDCNLQVLSTDVSRRHCQIMIGESDVAIRDLGSGNGTIINSQKAKPNVDTPLTSGDIIRIGPLVIKMEFEAASHLATSEQTVSTPAANSLPVEADIPDDEPISEGVLEPVDDDLEAEPFLKPADDDELLPDDELLADDAGKPDPAAPSVDDSLIEESTPAEPQSGKMKSLFGMFGKKKNEDTTAADSSAATPVEESVEESGDADSEPLLVADDVDFDEQTVVFDQQNAFTPEEEELELLADDEGLSDEGDYLDEEPDDEAVDPGFADFLKNVDPPPT